MVSVQSSYCAHSHLQFPSDEFERLQSGWQERTCKYVLGQIQAALECSNLDVLTNFTKMMFEEHMPQTSMEGDPSPVGWQSLDAALFADAVDCRSRVSPDENRVGYILSLDTVSLFHTLLTHR